MIKTEYLRLRQFEDKFDEFPYSKQGDNAYRYRVHKILSKDDIIDISLRWHFITNRIAKYTNGEVSFDPAYIEKLKLEKNEIKKILKIEYVSDSEIDYKYIQENIMPYVVLIKKPKDNLDGWPEEEEYTYTEFRKSFYY